jgi:hypothetical protein
METVKFIVFVIINSTINHGCCDPLRLRWQTDPGPFAISEGIQIADAESSQGRTLVRGNVTNELVIPECLIIQLLRDGLVSRLICEPLKLGDGYRVFGNLERTTATTFRTVLCQYIPNSGGLL